MKLTYPETRSEDTFDELAGVTFPDPYHWLDNTTDEVRDWQRAQAELASGYVRNWKHFDRLHSLVTRFSTERHVSLPRFAGGRWFRASYAPNASQAHVRVADEPMGEGVALFDPAAENPQKPPFLSWLSPSPDGQMLAVGICADGSESNTIRLIDVASGRLLPNPPSETLMDNWMGGAHWLPDSSGFFFTAMLGEATELEQRAFLHRRLPEPSTLLLDISWLGGKDFRMVTVSSDGRHAVALERNSDVAPVAIANLTESATKWRPFVTKTTGTVTGHVLGDRYIAITNVGASRGRLVAIPLNAVNPDDPSGWQELLAESDAVLRTVTPVDDVLYVTELIDTYARVRVVSLEGKALGEVPLPGRGAIGEQPFPLMNLAPKGHPNKFLFAFSSLTTSWTLYSHTPGRNELETLSAPAVQLEDAVIEDAWAVSADGTRIPYHMVYGKNVGRDRPQPTLIYAYGGFNNPFVPQFPGPMAAFVAAGGVLIHAHLRGGAEFGLDWRNEGRFKKKQNTYSDLYAVAEQLIGQGRCTPQLLALTGASNGGLTTGVAITQRPDLWAVGVPRVPRLDLIGACHTGYGRRSTIGVAPIRPDRPRVDNCE